jgi:hypothetical protein
MMAESIVAASPYAERIVAGSVLLLSLILVGISLLRPAAGADVLERWEASLTPPRERALLLTILAATLLMRTVGWSRPLTSPFWFAEKTTLSVASVGGHAK